MQRKPSENINDQEINDALQLSKQPTDINHDNPSNPSSETSQGILEFSATECCKCTFFPLFSNKLNVITKHQHIKKHILLYTIL